MAQLPTPSADCPLCPRLVQFRDDNRTQNPYWHNAPVPSFGPVSARLLIVGLAPGLRGANRTGRPFTGDGAGDALYPALLNHGFAEGTYGQRPDDGLRLVDCRITNAVRCVPPENRPTGAEAAACRPFLKDEIAAMQGLRIILALGGIAHNAVLATLGARRKDHPFAHGALHAMAPGMTLADSYHCSRYNLNTRRLTPEMFHAVFATLVRRLN
jgi:uracil-DNA glycosylase family 4